tara:strand:+ start:25 stop:282 length:258 start_codon:yes stop_codon:yes gene_type:complete
MPLKVLKGTECFVSLRRDGTFAPISDSYAKTEFTREAVVQVDESLSECDNLSPIMATVGDISSLIGDHASQTVVWIKAEDLIKIN